MPRARRIQQAPPITAEDPMHRRVVAAYSRPGHAIAFSTPTRAAKHFNISVKRAKKILEHEDGYTLHREYKQPKIYNPYYVHSRREQVQADLIDVSKIAASNNNTTFLLVLIDIFTKRLWVYPLRNKSGASMRAALRLWFASLDTPPKKMMTDRGTEFTNYAVRSLLRSHGVEWQPANGTLKACIAERVNKTLQELIYKYMTQYESTNYIDRLPDIVRTYNKRIHSTIKMSPEEGDRPENEQNVRAILHQKYEKISRQRRAPKLKLGAMVRVKTEPKKISSSSRSYAEQFKGEYFKIMRINMSLPIPLYYLKSMDDGELIEGGFYANELQQVRGDVFKIESQLRERRRRGRREVFVKWKYFGPQWNEWIPADSIVRVF